VGDGALTNYLQRFMLSFHISGLRLTSIINVRREREKEGRKGEGKRGRGRENTSYRVLVLLYYFSE